MQAYEVLKDDLVKSGYIQSLEMAEDFFVHKLSFEKVCVIYFFDLIINIYRLKAVKSFWESKVVGYVCVSNEKLKLHEPF